LRAELERLSRALDNDAKIASQRVETIIAGLNNLKRDTAANGGQDVQLRALEREAKAQRDLLESYLAKYREATARESIGAAPPDARTNSRALVSNVPASPKKIPIILISTLVTMFLAMTFVVAGEFLGTVPGETGPSNPVKRSIHIGSSVLDLLRRRAPATVAHSAEPAAARAAPAMDGLISGPPLADVVRGLRGLGEEGRRIGVIGVGRNVGTTHTAIRLARALAQDKDDKDSDQDARVVLVDLALKAPNLGVISSQPAAPGIANLIRGQASFGSIITRDRFSRVHLISAGEGEPEGTQLLSSPRLTMTMAALARAYRHVVVDAGAIDETEAALIARLTPRIVLVSTDLAQPETRAARDRLLASGFSDVTVFLGTPSIPSSEAA
jgi:Mrp family chromosome partitioning ATPase